MKAPADYQSPSIRSNGSRRRAKTRGWRSNTRRSWVVKYAMAAEAPHNVVEQDNRGVKRHIQPMVGFKSPRIGQFNFGLDRNSAHNPEKETRRRLPVRVLFQPCCVRGRRAASYSVTMRTLRRNCSKDSIPTCWPSASSASA